MGLRLLGLGFSRASEFRVWGLGGLGSGLKVLELGVTDMDIWDQPVSVCAPSLASVFWNC